MQSSLKDKKILIVGYGLEGKSAEKFVKKHYPTSQVTIVDQRDGPDYLSKQNEFDIAIKSPGVPKKLITIPYTTPTNLFFEAVDRKKIIGVTGSKGKSTTASLITSILNDASHKAKLLGNIGKPMLDAILDKNEDDTWYICELSSYQLDDIKCSPHIAVVVSLFSDHVPYHGSQEEYFNAKKNIVRYQTKDDYFVYNPRFPQLVEWGRTVSSQTKPYDDFIIKDTHLIGQHNADNIRAAATVAHILGIADDTIIQSVKNFSPLPHRLEFVGKYNQIGFYDDAISTTPESTIAAINAIPNVKTIFLGGTDRGYDFSHLVKTLSELEIVNLILFPQSGKRIKELIDAMPGYKPRIFETTSMKEGVTFAYTHTSPNSVCLLSCASPSYSLWKNFEEKGAQFQQFVKELGNEKKTE